MFFFLILATFIVTESRSEAEYLTKKPSFIPSCQTKDPEFTQCSTRTIQCLFTGLVENGGLPGIKSVPPVDPLKVSKIQVTESGNEAINIKLDLSNVTVEGLANQKVIENRVNRKDYSWTTKFYLPKLSIGGDYVLQGRILLIALNGFGKMSFEIENLYIILWTTTRLYEKDGLVFYNVTSTDCDYTISKMTTYFGNLFNGNVALEENTNRFFNENWETLDDALKPVIRKTIADVFLNYLQGLFHALPAEFFITDIPSPRELYGE